MHRRFEEARPLTVVHDEATYINPAVVPRIRQNGPCELHHHVELSLSPAAPSVEDRVRVEERWVELIQA
jgi:hypothetical protein